MIYNLTTNFLGIWSTGDFNYYKRYSRIYVYICKQNCI